MSQWIHYFNLWAYLYVLDGMTDYKTYQSLQRLTRIMQKQPSKQVLLNWEIPFCMQTPLKCKGQDQLEDDELYALVAFSKSMKRNIGLVIQNNLKGSIIITVSLMSASQVKRPLNFSRQDSKLSFPVMQNDTLDCVTPWQ